MSEWGENSHAQFKILLQHRPERMGRAKKNPVNMHLGSDSKLTPSQHEVGELMAMGRSGSMQK